MPIAIIVGLLAGLMGWRRASARGGTTTDKLQFAAAHGIPAFLIVMIGLTVAARAGWLD